MLSSPRRLWRQATRRARPRVLFVDLHPFETKTMMMNVVAEHRRRRTANLSSEDKANDASSTAKGSDAGDGGDEEDQNDQNAIGTLFFLQHLRCYI